MAAPARRMTNPVVDRVTPQSESAYTVKRVADGLTDQRSTRAQKILPAGALLWGWDADPDNDEAAGEQWLILLPEKWNKHESSMRGAST